MTKLTTKQANARAKAFYVTLSTAKSNFQSLFKDLVESWDTTLSKDNNPINTIMQACKVGNKTSGWIAKANKLLKANSTLELYFKKRDDNTTYYGLRLQKGAENVVIEQAFYDSDMFEEEAKDEDKPQKSGEELLKAYIEKLVKGDKISIEKVKAIIANM